MANLYVMERGNIRDESNYVRQDFTVFDLLTSQRDGVIEGIRFLEKGTSQWQEEINAFIKRIGESRSQEEITAMRERLVERQMLYAFPGIRGIKYNLYCRGFDGTYFNFISDPERNVVANIVVPERRIIVAPLINPLTGREDMFLFGKWGKASTLGYYYYDGTLEEALREFERNGFGFDRARPPVSSPEYSELTELPWGQRVKILEKGVSLDEALSLS